MSNERGTNTGSAVAVGVSYMGVDKSTAYANGVLASVRTWVRAGRQGLWLQIILHKIIRHLARLATLEIRCLVSVAVPLIDGKGWIRAERPHAID